MLANFKAQESSNLSCCLNSSTLFIQTTPQQVIEDVFDFDCGANHVAFITNDKIPYSFGSNSEGQLGIRTLKKLDSPQKMEIDGYFKEVKCGPTYTILIKENNEVWCFGKFMIYKRFIGSSGILLHELSPIKIKFIECANDFIIGVDENNIVFELSTNLKTLTHFDDNIISISCGFEHCLLLLEYGQVYSFGKNSNGQLGFNASTTSVDQFTLVNKLPVIDFISCGNYHSLCIDIEGKLWHFGNFWNTNYFEPKHNTTMKERVIYISSKGKKFTCNTADHNCWLFGCIAKNDPMIMRNKEYIINYNKQKSARK